MKKYLCIRTPDKKWIGWKTQAPPIKKGDILTYAGSSPCINPFCGHISFIETGRNAYFCQRDFVEIPDVDDEILNTQKEKENETEIVTNCWSGITIK